MLSVVRKSALSLALVAAAALAAPLNSAAVAPAAATGVVQGTVLYSPGLDVLPSSQSFSMSGTMTGVSLGSGVSLGPSTFSGSGTESTSSLAGGVGSVSMFFNGAISGGATGTMARSGPVPIIVLHGTLTVLGITECYDIGIAGYFLIAGPPPVVVVQLAGWAVLAPGTNC